MSSELQVQGAVEGAQIPGGSCCTNSQGWLWIKHSFTQPCTQHCLKAPAAFPCRGEGVGAALVWRSGTELFKTLNCFLECCSVTGRGKP